MTATPPIPMWAGGTLDDYKAHTIALINLKIAGKYETATFTFKGEEISLSAYSQIRNLAIQTKKGRGTPFPQIKVANKTDTAVVTIDNATDADAFFDAGWDAGFPIHQDGTAAKEGVLAATTTAEVDAAAGPFLLS